MKVSRFLKIFLFIFCHSLFAYQTSKTTSLLQVKWPAATSVVNVYMNASNSYGVSESSLQTIATNSAAQWNGVANITLNIGTTAGIDQDGLNEIYFTSDSTVFNSSNSAVAAVTLVSFQESDGKILEADVKINESNLIDTTQTSTMYIGNILTHELGHLLGLDHSQAIGSTMFWLLSLGQNEVSPDDKAGLYTVYPTGSSSYGKLTGTVVGSSNQYGVFGVEVQAISQSSGKIIGTSTTENDGTFTINGLPQGDRYFIYTRPSVISTLSSHFSKAKTNFCDSGQAYRGSFYQACGGGNVGYPQAISLNSSSVDTGKITIRCALDVPTEYLQKKTNGDSSYNVITDTSRGIGNSFVGFFSNQSIANNTATDTYKIDLSNISSSTWNSLDSSTLYLSVHLINQTLYSPYQADMTITKGASTYSSSRYVLNSDGWYDVNPILYIPIDKSMASNNIFTINLKANQFPITNEDRTVILQERDILPDYSEFADSMYFYLLNAQIVKSNGDGTYSVVSSKSYVVSDNSSCTDATNTYQLTNYTVTGTTDSGSRKSAALACGTVDMNSGNGSGPFGMIVGFSLSFLFVLCLKRMRFI